MICPYYQQDYKTCNFYSTNQDEGQREAYCLSSDNWRRCANYDKSSYDYRVSKRLRPNPDL